VVVQNLRAFQRPFRLGKHAQNPLSHVLTLRGKAKSNVRLTSTILVLLALLAGCSDHGNSLEDFAERAITIDGKQYRYRVFVPKKRDPNAKTAVMLYLHGSGARGDDNYAQADAFGGTIGPVRDKVNFIVVLPQCREGTFWSSTEMADYSLAALDETVKEFNGDPERIHLAGFSLGGYGVWQIAAANPGRFAALVSIAGGFVGARPIEERDRAAILPVVKTMLDSQDPYKALAGAIGQTPAWLFHGANDDAVPVDFSRKIVRALEDAGNKNVKYTEYADEGHIVVANAFREPGFFEWLAGQRRR
jgi:predicted peptidase